MRERTGAAECWRRCYYCGFDDAQVEAAGVWRCPNALCPGPGASWCRSRLHSYREVDGGRHTVDEEEWIAAGLVYADTLEDAALAVQIRATARRMREP